jgi:hypothetical protein
MGTYSVQSTGAERRQDPPGRIIRRRGKFVTEAMLDGLPKPVQRYLRYTGVIGKPFVRTVHLRQSEKLLLVSGQPWIPLQAQQWYSVRTPGFVWYATLHIGPVPIVRALDMYQTGLGRMLIKAASLITVADAKGKEIDEGEIVRYLSEMMWFPSAFLEDNVSSRRSTPDRLGSPSLIMAGRPPARFPSMPTAG